MEKRETEALVRRMNAISGVFQVGYLDLLLRLNAIHGGPGPWLDEIEAELLKSAKSHEMTRAPGGYEDEANATAGAIEAVTQFFLFARPRLASGNKNPAG